MNSVSSAASSAWSKTKSSVTGLWGGPDATTDQAGNRLAADDPTRLSSPGTASANTFVQNGAVWENRPDPDYAKALESYNNALKLEPGNAAALASVARVHMRQENFPQAAEYFRKAIAANPADPALLNDYGMTQARLGDLAGATQSISQALSISHSMQGSPGTSRFANNLANVRYDMGDSAGALAVLLQHNKPAVAHFNMAYLHFHSGNHAEAKAELDEVLRSESLAERDSAIATAVSRSREMLTQMDGGAERVAQAVPRAVTGTSQGVTAPHSAAQAQPGQAMTPPSYSSMPPAGYAPPAGTPTAAAVAPATAGPGAGPGASGQGGPFALPPGVFDQSLR